MLAVSDGMTKFWLQHGGVTFLLPREADARHDGTGRQPQNVAVLGQLPSSLVHELATEHGEKCCAAHRRCFSRIVHAG